MPAGSDVLVVGGGPGGLAAAIACAQRGLSVVLLERASFPCDKACGEGLLPPALRALEALAVRSEILPSESVPLRALRYVQENGSVVEARLPDGGGLAMRRTTLERLLLKRAAALGVQLRDNTAVRAHGRTSEDMRVTLEGGETLAARLLVAADGLGSPRRAAEGLNLPMPKGGGRFGVRRHFRIAPWTDAVEIHVTAGAEAYATPIARDEVGVAILWRDGEMGVQASHEKLLERFPALRERLGSAAPSSEARGAGPFERRVRARVADRFALLGDAAGYHDAISGEGLALALSAAVKLGEIAPEALRLGGTAAALAPYDRACARQFRHYRWVSAAMVAIARRPTLRRVLLGVLGHTPRLFDRLVAFGILE